MIRTIEDIQKDIELLGIKGGYDIEQLLTPQDCRRLSYEIERLNNIIKEVREETEKQLKGAICQEFTDLKVILRILDKGE